MRISHEDTLEETYGVARIIDMTDGDGTLKRHGSVRRIAEIPRRSDPPNPKLFLAERPFGPENYVDLIVKEGGTLSGQRDPMSETVALRRLQIDFNRPVRFQERFVNEVDGF